MVHQHFMLVPVFTVAENVTLGMEETRPSGLLDRRKARRDVRELSRRYGLAVDPDALVEDLPVGIQQRVEIIKALVRDASVLILDEPTAVLTPAETDDLFRIIRQLKDGGTSIVFISHKLKEVQAIADTITVLRRGAVVGEQAAVRHRGRARRDDGRPERAAEGQQGPGQARRRGARRRGPDGRGRDRPGLGERDVVPGPRGRDPRPGGRAGQRADRAVRGAARAAADRVRAHPAGRPRPHPQHAPAAAARGDRLRPRGPAGRRAGRRLLGGRQHDPGQLRPAAVRLGHQPAPGRHRQQRGRTGGGVRRPHPVRGHAGGHAVRRQPAEGHPGQGTRPGPQGAGGQPADPGPGRGLDRVRAPPHRAAARPRRGRAHRLVRAGRDLRARGPDRGHVRGPDHRLPAALGAGGGTGPADGRIGSPRNPGAPEPPEAGTPEAEQAGAGESS